MTAGNLSATETSSIIIFHKKASWARVIKRYINEIYQIIEIYMPKFYARWNFGTSAIGIESSEKIWLKYICSLYKEAGIIIYISLTWSMP